jgi:hypothetical protein
LKVNLILKKINLSHISDIISKLNKNDSIN